MPGMKHLWLKALKFAAELSIVKFGLTSSRRNSHLVTRESLR